MHALLRPVSRSKSLRLLLFVAIFCIYSLLASNPSAATPRVKAEIVRVVDGDTVVVRLASQRTEHVRLIGIDTPESKPNKRAALQAERSHRDQSTILALGKQAFHHTESLAPIGTQVELEYDVQARDKYRRLLAYVYLPSGKMLNEEIVSAGYAQLLTIPPNVRYTRRFQDAYGQSRANHRGLWTTEKEW